MSNPRYVHVDVFAHAPLSGNGLTVFLDCDTWSIALMQRLTQEMKQFESIFLSAITADGAHARIFTVEEELPFAGHPVLGAAVVLHRLQAAQTEHAHWRMSLPSGVLSVTTRKIGAHYLAEMNQGRAVFGNVVEGEALASILARLGLDAGDLAPGFPAQVISTGLPYLIVPVTAAALARTAINGDTLDALLAAQNARFVLVLDVAARELRTWDNLGRCEDVATGSAAGPVAAYLLQHAGADRADALALAQGRYAGRPSRLHARCTAQDEWLVSGEVWPLSSGVLDLDPSELASVAHDR